MLIFSEIKPYMAVSACKNTKSYHINTNLIHHFPLNLPDEHIFNWYDGKW
jgi:hypothetical protein